MRPPLERHAPVITTEDECVACGCPQGDKFDTTLMCSLGHTTCFRCVAKGVQPHPLCFDSCNGFKYQCAECATWSCVNKTQELAMMCGRHSVARERLQREKIPRDDFNRQRICTCDDDTSSGQDTSSSDELSDSSSSSTEHVQLPRVCHIDWSRGHVQRAQRLARLRSSLLGEVQARNLNN